MTGTLADKRWQDIEEWWEEEVKREAVKLYDAGLDPERAMYEARRIVIARHQLHRGGRVGGSEVKAEVKRSEELDRRHADWGRETEDEGGTEG